MNFCFITLFIIITVTSLAQERILQQACPVCGFSAEVANSDAIFSYPGQMPLPCGDFAILALQGRVPQQICTENLPLLVNATCRCMPSVPSTPTILPSSPHETPATVVPSEILIPPVVPSLPPFAPAPAIPSRPDGCPLIPPDGCAVCGDPNWCVTNFYYSFLILPGLSVTCAELEAAAIAGMVDSSQCSAAQNTLPSDCKCREEGIQAPISPVAAVTTTPTSTFNPSYIYSPTEKLRDDSNTFVRIVIISFLSVLFFLAWLTFDKRRLRRLQRQLEEREQEHPQQPQEAPQPRSTAQQLQEEARLRERVLNALFPPQNGGPSGRFVFDTETKAYSFTPDASSNEGCSICLEDFSPDDHQIISGLCTHSFHRECLMNWLIKRNKDCCPECRQVMWDPETYEELERVMRRAEVGAVDEAEEGT